MSENYSSVAFIEPCERPGYIMKVRDGILVWVDQEAWNKLRNDIKALQDKFWQEHAIGVVYGNRTTASNTEQGTSST